MASTSAFSQEPDVPIVANLFMSKPRGFLGAFGDAQAPALAHVLGLSMFSPASPSLAPQFGIAHCRAKPEVLAKNEELMGLLWASVQKQHLSQGERGKLVPN